MIDICCIGHITHDRIITEDQTTNLNGGTAFYFSHAIARLPEVNYQLVTAIAEADRQAVYDLNARGVDVQVLPSANTVFFENKYGRNMNNRTQRVLAKADPFTAEQLNDVQARFIHLGSLLADDFSVDTFATLAGRGILSVDAQGFLRYVDGVQVRSCPWEKKIECLQYVDILKVNEHEIESLTGHTDLLEAGSKLASWGVKEVLMTLGSYGSAIYTNGELIQIPAFPPRKVVDATGCGDTYACGYLYMRSLGAGYATAGRFAAALSTLNIERSGPYMGDLEQVLQRL